jgi:hypothetical protein
LPHDGRSLDHDVVVQHDAGHGVRRFDLRQGFGHAGFHATALGIVVPPNLLVSATEIIE